MFHFLLCHSFNHPPERQVLCAPTLKTVNMDSGTEALPPPARALPPPTSVHAVAWMLAHVRAHGVRACVRTCMHACVRACVCAMKWKHDIPRGTSTTGRLFGSEATNSHSHLLAPSAFFCLVKPRLLKWRWRDTVPGWSGWAKR